MRKNSLQHVKKAEKFLLTWERSFRFVRPGGKMKKVDQSTCIYHAVSTKRLGGSSSSDRLSSWWFQPIRKISKLKCF